jgi:chemotaxis-related protein WspB
LIASTSWIDIAMLVLVFYLGEVMYIIKYERVREVSPMVLLKPIPRMPDYFAGFFNYRGMLVPVIDLRRLIQGDPCRMRLSTRIILVDYENGEGKSQVLGLMAERVTEAVRKPKENFVSAGINFDEAPYLNEFIMENNSMIQCIDLDKLVEKFRFLNLLDSVPHARLGY